MNKILDFLLYNSFALRPIIRVDSHCNSQFVQNFESLYARMIMCSKTNTEEIEFAHGNYEVLIQFH